MAKKYNISKLMEHNNNGTVVYFVTYNEKNCLLLAAGDEKDQVTRAKAHKAYREMLKDPAAAIAASKATPKRPRTLH